MDGKINENAWECVRNYVKNALLSVDSAHDFDHISRVVGTTKRLCEKIPEARVHLALLIAYLHEMNDDKLFSSDQTDVTRNMLSGISLSDEEISFIINSISLISYRKHPTLPIDTPIEVKIVQDADRIDALGAIGIARAFTYGGSKGRPIYSADKKGDTLSHFYEKLLLIYDLLNTDAAKEFAKERNDFLKLFVENLVHEANE